MNIFARELALVLAAHDKELSSLFSLQVDDGYGFQRPIAPSKVTRLKDSLSKNKTATLNADELDALEEWAKLTPEEVRRLRAALVAEAVRHLLAGRMMQQQAAEVGDLVLTLLASDDTARVQALRDQIVDGVRGALGDVTPAERAIQGAGGLPAAAAQDSVAAQVLEPATEIYEQGCLWLELARDTADRTARAGHVAQACGLLARARDAAVNAASAVQGTEAQAELVAVIDATLAQADLLS